MRTAFYFISFCFSLVQICLSLMFIMYADGVDRDRCDGVCRRVSGAWNQPMHPLLDDPVNL